MDRSAVFVDAGYLFAQGSTALCGQKRPRGMLQLDIEAAVDAIRSFAFSVTGLPLLRIYWYDGTSDGPTVQHRALAFSQDVKVRLGLVNLQGQQKGVDSLLVTDMINLSRNRAMASAVLLTGDEDLRVGVQHAQDFGVRVHLVGIEPARQSQSDWMLQEADVTHEWTRGFIEQFLAVLDERASQPVLDIDVSEDDDAPAAVALAVFQSTPPAEIDALVQSLRRGDPSIPRDIDRQLLLGLEKILSERPDFAMKVRLRDEFKRLCFDITEPADD